MTDEAVVERNKRIRDIKNLYAFYLFSQHKFEDSLRLFAELGTGYLIILFCSVVDS